MDIEKTAAMAGLTVEEVRQGVKDLSFPLPRTCGGESWDYRDVAQWCRENGVTPPSGETLHETQVRGMLHVSPSRLYQMVRDEGFPGPIGETKRWNADRVRDAIANHRFRRALG